MEKRETSADEAVEARGKKAVDDLKALKNNRASKDCAGGKFPDCKTRKQRQPEQKKQSGSAG